jgi:hypothetical protein
MSLINDALKRAKQAQRQTPPPEPTLQFRPVEPGQERKAAGPWGLVTILLFFILALAAAWGWIHRGSGPTVAKATESTSVAVMEPAPLTQPPAETLAPKDHAAIEPAKPLATQAAVASPAPAPTAVNSQQPAASTPNSPPTVAPEPSANVAVAAAPEPPKPPALKLQGIAFHPTRPSAMISGKTVFVGEKVGEWRVQAIRLDTAILVSAGQTNILTLQQ